MSEPDPDCKRRDPRYVETSTDLSDWIQVRLVEQFGDRAETSGLLVDLTPRAVKVAFPAAAVAAPLLAVGKKLLVTFRFRNLKATTATATISRIDEFSHGVATVLFFDLIREEDRSTITEACEGFHRPAGDEQSL